MKICIDCEVEKELDRFPLRGPDGARHNQCKECQRIKARAHYKNNRKSYLDRIKPEQRELRAWLFEQKVGPCQDCGGQFKPWQMDFDHRDPVQKTMEVSAMVGKRMSKDRILTEIAKCDLICANCHRDRTYRRQRWDREI